MKCISNTLGLALFITALAGCGGGGSDNGNAQPAAQPRTQDEVKATATLGLLTTEITSQRDAFTLSYLAGTLVGLSGISSGSVPLNNISCTSGTHTRTVTKSATRIGLAAGDAVTDTFSNCDVIAGTIVNGAVTITAQNAVVNASVGNYDISYSAELSGFSIKNNNVTTTYAGSIVATAKASGGTYAVTFVVPAAKTLRMEDGGGFVCLYQSGATFAMTAAGSSETHRLDGSVVVSKTLTTTPGIPLALSTTQDLSGSTASGRLVATVGTLNVRETTTNLATSLAFSGSTATVSGDSNGDGSMDLVFRSTWDGLLVP
jgi:hypothetical protein